MTIFAPTHHKSVDHTTSGKKAQNSVCWWNRLLQFLNVLLWREHEFRRLAAQSNPVQEQFLLLAGSRQHLEEFLLLAGGLLILRNQSQIRQLLANLRYGPRRRR